MSLYCDTPLPAYAEDICANEEGRIIAVAYLRSDATITDYTSAAEWNADIAAGRTVIIKNVRGEKPKSSANSIDGFGRQKSRTVGRDFTTSYQHPDVVGNEDFYNVLNYDSSHRFAFYTQGGKVWVVEDAIADVDADFNVPMGLNDIIVFEVAVSWSTQPMPIAYNAPASVFEI